MTSAESNGSSDPYTTIEVAGLLGMAVRSVQLMVDRGELEAWKTPGGHRRIARESVERWLAGRGVAAPARAPTPPQEVLAAVAPATALPSRAPARQAAHPPPHGEPLRVLLIEDSVHFQNLVSLLVKRELPGADLHVADEGISGLAMAGRFEPHVLLVDILLPGIDGAALITSLRSHPEFQGSQLIVVTSLDEAQRAPYAFALDGVPVVHKSRLALDLPNLLAAAAKNARKARTAAA